jgi:DNA-binding transcriptional LysR family regulator
VARAFAEQQSLALFAPPLPLPGFRIAMYWHERHHAAPAHQFLRAELLRAAKSLPRARRR